MVDFGTPFQHFSWKLRFSRGGCASRHVRWRTPSTWKPHFSGKVLEGCAKIKPRIDFRSILAHPSSTFPEKWGFRVGGVRQRTSRDAHLPHENLTFQEKCRKGVPKSSPESTFSRKNLLKPTRELNPRKSRFCCFSPHRGETLVRLVFYDVSKRWFFMILCNRQKSAKRRNSKKWQNSPCFYSKNHRFWSLGFRVSVGSVQSPEKCKT